MRRLQYRGQRKRKRRRVEEEKKIVDLWSKFFSANFQSAGGRGSRAGSCRLFQTRRSGHLLPSGVPPPPSVPADLNLGPAALCTPPPPPRLINPTPPPPATARLCQSEEFHSCGTEVCPPELLLASSRSILCVVLCCVVVGRRLQSQTHMSKQNIVFFRHCRIRKVLSREQT